MSDPFEPHPLFVVWQPVRLRKGATFGVDAIPDIEAGKTGYFAPTSMGSNGIAWGIFWHKPGNMGSFQCPWHSVEPIPGDDIQILMRPEVKE
ncbi:hypothetical protein [Rhodococcus qingshengii]|jgi:hypothetical protein|uniref:Uncharacterized protein n=1 Tax=Rhodococcus qingshengii TaxID=334542 RepID=A0A2A5JE25_RHOSG|nr:hypothetical protein [Rhodococcus qingshengii]PCK27830.1 hypothetical protein CHR55_10120 [Rhodococcus qingshengii]